MEFPEFTTDEIFGFGAYEENGYCFVAFPKKLEDVNSVYYVFLNKTWNIHFH